MKEREVQRIFTIKKDFMTTGEILNEEEEKVIEGFLDYLDY